MNDSLGLILTQISWKQQSLALLKAQMANDKSKGSFETETKPKWLVSLVLLRSEVLEGKEGEYLETLCQGPNFKVWMSDAIQRRGKLAPRDYNCIKKKEWLSFSRESLEVCVSADLFVGCICNWNPLIRLTADLGILYIWQNKFDEGATNLWMNI